MGLLQVVGVILLAGALVVLIQKLGPRWVSMPYVHGACILIGFVVVVWVLSIIFPSFFHHDIAMPHF